MVKHYRKCHIRPFVSMAFCTILYVAYWGLLGIGFFKSLDMLQNFYELLHPDRCPMGENGTAVPWKETDRGRSGKDNRLFIEAVSWIARTGSP
ncbi:hypothetical protein [Komagataeibacter diospyri]|uniref:hypothetical protein n=1 Tax=Komagataeibacter diospyri TaxID=1932662 RepID=UPI001873C5BF|nr:hypothetical protein [Komagataeibacter diospyri]